MGGRGSVEEEMKEKQQHYYSLKRQALSHFRQKWSPLLAINVDSLMSIYD